MNVLDLQGINSSWSIKKMVEFLTNKMEWRKGFHFLKNAEILDYKMCYFELLENNKIHFSEYVDVIQPWSNRNLSTPIIDKKKLSCWLIWDQSILLEFFSNCKFFFLNESWLRLFVSGNTL